MWPDVYDEWARTNPYWEQILNDFGFDEIWYTPDSFEGKRMVASTDYTHVFSRLRRFTMKRKSVCYIL